jgi:hypothetical protein
MMEFYLVFEIDDHSGKELSFEEVESRHYSRVSVLQKIAFKYFKDSLLDMSLCR